MIQKYKKGGRKEVNVNFFKTQKVLSGRVFDPKTYEKHCIVYLVKNVSHHGWLHLLKEPTSIVFKKEVREFDFTMDF